MVDEPVTSDETKPLEPPHQPHPDIPDDPTEIPYYQYPGNPPSPGSGGSGCWIVGLISAVIVMLVGLVVLFLPPVNLVERLLGDDHIVLNSIANAAQASDTRFKVSVSPDDIGDNFGVSIASLSVDSFLNSTTTPSRAALPNYLAPQSAIYTIKTTGTAPNTVNLTIDLPASTANAELLDFYGWFPESGQWEFLASQIIDDGSGQPYQYTRSSVIPAQVGLFQVIPADPTIITTLNIGETIPQQIINMIDIVSPTGMQPSIPSSPQRTLIGNPAPGFDIGAPYQVMPVIRNYADNRAADPTTVVALLTNQDLLQEHIQQLTAFTNAGGYDGIFIDYRDMPTEQRSTFTKFIKQLSTSLASYGLQLGVILPSAENQDGSWQTGAYDWRALGTAADYVQINFSPAPTAFIPGVDQLTDMMVHWAVREVGRQKLIVGLSALSLEENQGTVRPVSYAEALAPLGNVSLDVAQSETGTVAPGSEISIALDGLQAVPGVDTTVQAPFINYIRDDGTVSTTMWLTTAEALRFRMNRFIAFNLGGIGFADLLAPGVADGVLAEVLNFKVQIPGQTVEEPELVLNWRIEGEQGQLTEFTTRFNEPIVMTLQAPDGNYLVNVDVVGSQIVSPRNGASVALFAPTATPTPLPTSTPVPTATPTPTLVPIVPTSAPVVASAGDGGAPAGSAPVVSGAVSNPGSGSISLSGFEYGGHVTSTGSQRAIGAMNSAGMTWMKVQIRYGVGQDLGSAQQAINQAHGAGFKILLGIVGFPDQLRDGGGDYIRQFAGYVGSVAGLGPDAIEVWNEPNLAREWPEGQISGGNYTALLAEAYRAIKSVNGGVLVISGAPAPTGAENAYPGKVVNDDNFLRQMVAAGAMNYVDCVGMHYNEGLVNPRATSGDPRDNFYSRYLPSMVDLYWGATGGQKPICVTELGYLTPEGYPPLDPFFGWAANMTVAHHAAYLADAAAYLSQSGRARLMIVWNVDFTRYDSDPMAGYAMIRANGDCPACRTLAGAR